MLNFYRKEVVALPARLTPYIDSTMKLFTVKYAGYPAVELSLKPWVVMSANEGEQTHRRLIASRYFELCKRKHRDIVAFPYWRWSEFMIHPARSDA